MKLCAQFRIFAVAVLAALLLASAPIQSIAEEDASKGPNSSENSEPSNDIDDIAIPQIHRDLEKLPFPVKRMRELILEAAHSADLEKLRAYIGIGENGTMLSLGGFDGDPIDFLKSQSGDPQGHEILAILTEILESGYVVMDKGTEQEIYVWPYHFAMPIEKLTPQQRVELFRIITFGDFQDMKDFGGYIFYRIGISPKGRWEFFVAGD